MHFLSLHEAPKHLKKYPMGINGAMTITTVPKNISPESVLYVAYIIRNLEISKSASISREIYRHGIMPEYHCCLHKKTVWITTIFIQDVK